MAVIQLNWQEAIALLMAAGALTVSVIYLIALAIKTIKGDLG